MKKEKLVFIETEIVRVTKYIGGLPHWIEKHVFCYAEALEIANKYGAFMMEWKGWLYLKLSDNEWYAIRSL